MSAAGNTRRDKEAKSRVRACFDKEIVHIRCGDWRGPQVEAVGFVGMVGDLHGTVCTCCPPRRQEDAA